MNFERIYSSGDRITLHDGNREYTTRIDEITSPESFTVLQPWELGLRFTTHVGAIYKTVGSTASGVHYCTMETVGVDISAKVRTMHLKYAGKYYRVQNRSAFRCQALLPVELRKRPEEGQQAEPWLYTTTLDISTSGVKLRLKPGFNTGDVLQMHIRVNKFGLDAALPMITGMVVRTTPTADGTHDTFSGIEFTDIAPKALDTLTKFVMLYQRHSSAS